MLGRRQALDHSTAQHSTARPTCRPRRRTPPRHGAWVLAPARSRLAVALGSRISGPPRPAEEAAWGQESVRLPAARWALCDRRETAIFKGGGL